MINHDLYINRVGPVDEIKKSEIGNKNQSHSSLNFMDLMISEVLKNKKPEEKKVEKEPETPQVKLDDAKIAIANSYAIMNSFLIKNQKKEEYRGRSDRRD